jgi:predicted metalloenzyme YecM
LSLLIAVVFYYNFLPHPSNRRYQDADWKKIKMITPETATLQVLIEDATKTSNF